jgi:hypothetical protein
VSFLSDRIASGLQILRPRTLMQLRKSVSDSRKEIATLTSTVATLNESVRALEQSIQAQQGEIATLRLRESQLRSVAQRNLELEERASSLQQTLSDPGLCQHITRAIQRGKLQHEPFPHVVVDRLLPDALYESLIDGLPPAELFADRPPNRQQLRVPFHFAPDYSRRVWQFMSDVVVRDMLTPIIVEKFRALLDEWLRENFPESADSTSTLNLVCSDGRILLRTRGYHIRPHRDPKWGFITCIFYLARPGDPSSWGTDLYAVDEDQEARGAAPYWIDEKQCRQVGTVDFKRNRALIFLNSSGAHGADIPSDAEPATLERYIYQFRVGPDADSMRALTDNLPADRRVYWEGKQQSY